MFCPYCGMEIEDNSKFCPFCGEHLDDAAASAAPMTQALVPEIPEEPVQEAPKAYGPAPEPVPAAWQPEAPAPEYRPASEQQPVRFDQTNTYQYRQEYTPENPYGGQPASAAQEKPQKGNKKALLWIILGAAAALLVAGAVILVLALSSKGSSKASESHLLIVTTDSAYYLDDEKYQLCEDPSDLNIALDYSAALTSHNQRWYREANGEKTRIGGSSIRIMRYDTESISWVLYLDKDGDICLFRAGQKEDVVILEDASLNDCRVSNNGKYVAFCAYGEKDCVILRVNTSTGEAATIFEDRDDSAVIAVDNDGCVYYYDTDEEIHVSDGKNDVTLEDINRLVLMKDVLLCSEENDRKGTVKIYTRSIGMKGEMKPLSDWLPEEFWDDTEAYTIGVVNNSYGYRAFQSNDRSYTNSLIVEYEEDLYFVDLKAETYSILLADYSFSEITDIFLTEDLKTAYVRAGKTLFKLTANKEEWEKETLSKHCSGIRVLRKNGLIFIENDTDVVVYDGREAAVFEDLAQYTYDLSDDLKSVVYVNDNKVMYIKKAGEKAERVAKDNYGSRAVLFKNYIYYINDDGDLLKMKPGGDPEVLMEDVRSITHLAY